MCMHRNAHEPGSKKPLARTHVRTRSAAYMQERPPLHILPLSSRSRVPHLTATEGPRTNALCAVWHKLTQHKLGTHVNTNQPCCWHPHVGEAGQRALKQQIRS